MLRNMEKELDCKVEVEDFPDNYRRIAQIIGIKPALDLIKQSGGINQYIPLYDAVTKNARDRLIKEEFDGSNYQALALKYNMSEAWVRTLLEKETRRKYNEELQRQQTALAFE